MLSIIQIALSSEFKIIKLIAQFVHHDLRLLNPSFDSPLVDVLNELEHLRRLQLGGDTPAPIFFQLKSIFHMLESLGSARIEGNHTTLADYVESRIGGKQKDTDPLREIANIELAMDYIEDVIRPGEPMTEHFIRELHALTVTELEREGDKTPGAYRATPVQIAQSAHLPPEAIQVAAYMQELVDFINHDDAPKYDLMKVALAHHRFGWVHPFGNGNGRVVRLLTYALLIKYGFNVRAGGRLLNPTAVFCNDRACYYAMLGTADQGAPGALERWCEYVLSGVMVGMKKIDRLTDYGYLQQRILLPALDFARGRELITSNEFAILAYTIAAGTLRAGDLATVLPALNANQRTYQIKKLVEQGMLQAIQEGARQYTAGFANSYLMRGVIRALAEENFIPEPLARP